MIARGEARRMRLAMMAKFVEKKRSARMKVVPIAATPRIIARVAAARGSKLPRVRAKERNQM